MLIELEDKIIELIENLDKDRFIFNFLSLYDFPKATITKLEKLEKLLDRTGKMKFFDPACGFCVRQIVK